jgi:hypothetical protein
LNTIAAEKDRLQQKNHGSVPYVIFSRCPWFPLLPTSFNTNTKPKRKKLIQKLKRAGRRTRNSVYQREGTMTFCFFSAPFFLLMGNPVNGFAPRAFRPRSQGSFVSFRTQKSVLQMNFFKDLMGKAFENDSTLDKDKTQGQYDGPDDNAEESISVARQVNPQLTETQQKWRERQQSSSLTTPQLLLNSKWKLDLYLTGVPDKDPSNDLFASKTNISSRDRKVGLSVPETPTVGDIVIKLLDNGECRVETESEFIDEDAGNGAWKLSDDGSMIRISLNVVGYQRTVQTKGTIQRVYWSKEDDQEIATSTAYSIPAGWMYGDATLKSGNQVGTLDWDEGICRVEQSTGLMGAATRMVPCGRFVATRMDS